MQEEKSTSEHPEIKREPLSLEQAEIFANNGAYEIKPGSENNARCVDGRYENVDLTPLASPGADAGCVMTVVRALREMHIKVSMEQALEVVLNIVGGISQFQFHTDEHSEKEKGLAGYGCGHLRQAKNDPEAYGLSEEDMGTLFKMLEKLKKQGAKKVLLKGEHAEGAVIVVKSDTKSVKTKDEKGGKTKMAFIFHDTLHRKRITKLALAIQKVIPPASSRPLGHIESALYQSSKNQLDQTLKRLAKGLPIYVVQPNGKGQFSIREQKSGV